MNELSVRTIDDTIKVKFVGENKQPYFLKHNGRDTLRFRYTIESVMFKISQGKLINGWMLKPKNKMATVTLLHLHGNAGTLLSQFRIMTPLVEQGFQVFLFDYSGFGFSEGKATRKNALEDGLSAVDYVKTREDVKNTKLVLYGQSFGGHLAVVVAEKKQEVIDGLVIEGAFSSPKDVAADRVPVIGRIAVSTIYSALRSMEKIHKPLLIIHSREDKVIPFYMGKKLFGKANQPAEFYEINKCHICGPLYYETQITEKITALLKSK